MVKYKKLKKERFTPIHILLVIFAVIQLFPLYFMITLSLKGNKEIFGENMIGLPKVWEFSNYKTALTNGNMLLYFTNSILVTGLTIVLTLLCAVMASYALQRMIWRGKEKMNGFFMLGLTVPIHASILPIFLILRNLKMLNSYQALILPYAAFSLAMAILICNGFISGIPRELEESACIDGCNVYGIFVKIIIPLMKPAFSTVAIFVYLQAWNELMFAVIFISEEKYRTLTVGIQTLSSAYTTDWGAIGAALVVATFPTILLYFFMSKKIQESMVAGAIKG
ncbi:carbohydrate ABC transporter permease [Blautia producta]|uniref:L-arabinose transport system permease protein AraQ n=1 Tax=Blautia producta TaxID=33035 RepID=A0A4P6M4W9_9FIRM|nr:carbohydrate ABC transporter permease [Blautia producta]QBE99562.1 L-arabinose transport system permease protein AraQ [Blautia producta]